MAKQQGFIVKGEGEVLTPSFRVSFPYVFEPNKDGKFGTVMIYDKDVDFSNLESLIQATLKAKWPKNPPKGMMLPILDGDDSDREEYQGKFYINGKIGKYKAGVVDSQRQPIDDPAELYAGCHARAILTCYAWTYMGKNGVSVNIRSIQKLRDDEPLVSFSSAENDFDEVDSFDGEDL